MHTTNNEINQELWLIHAKKVDEQKVKEAEQMLIQLISKHFGTYEQLFDHTLIVSVTVDQHQLDYKGVKINVVPHPQKSNAISLLIGTSVCTLHDHPEVDFMEMLQRNHDSLYAKVVVIDEEYLEVEALADYAHVIPEEITAIIREVAQMGYSLRKQLLKE